LDLKFGRWRLIPWADLNLRVQNRIALNADEGPIFASILDPEEAKDYWRTDVTITWQTETEGFSVYLDLLNVLDRDNKFPSAFNSEGGIADIEFTALVGMRIQL
jgi:hypothetical protein